MYLIQQNSRKQTTTKIRELCNKSLDDIRMKSNCIFLKLYISYLHWLALKFVSIFCISVILSTPNHDFVPKEPVSVSTKVRFGTQKVCFGTQKSVSVSREVRFGTQKVRSGPFRSDSVSTKVRFGTQKVRFGIHKSPFRSVPVSRDTRVLGLDDFGPK